MGSLQVLGQSGSLVDDTAVFVDRVSGTRTVERFERTAQSIGVSHPQLGRIEWRHPLLGSSMSDEQVAVAQHLESFLNVVHGAGTPLYSGAEALADIELLRALQYSADNGAHQVKFPLRSRFEKGRVAVHRLLHKAGQAG
jgi:hypothetical protein